MSWHPCEVDTLNLGSLTYIRRTHLLMMSFCGRKILSHQITFLDPPFFLTLKIYQPPVWNWHPYLCTPFSCRLISYNQNNSLKSHCSWPTNVFQSFLEPPNCGTERRLVVKFLRRVHHSFRICKRVEKGKLRMEIIQNGHVLSDSHVICLSVGKVPPDDLVCLLPRKIWWSILGNKGMKASAQPKLEGFLSFVCI